MISQKVAITKDVAITVANMPALSFITLKVDSFTRSSTACVYTKRNW